MRTLTLLLLALVIGAEAQTTPAAAAAQQLPLFPPDLVPVLLSNWTRRAAETAAAALRSNRTATVRRAADAAAGIYVDVARTRALRVEQYVMLTLTAVTDNPNNPGAKMAKNWLCYTAHYGFKPMLYYIEDVVKPEETSDGRGVAAFRALNVHAQFVTFPEHIFYALLAKKAGWEGTATQGGVVDFRGPRPSFKRFGPFLKVVPLLELVTLGYTAVFFDADVALVKDPVPFLAQGRATVAVSFETRNCDSFVTSAAFRKEKYAWRRFEPNSGVVVVRPQRGGVLLLSQLARALADAHKANDQAVWSLPQVEYDVSEDCHTNYDGPAATAAASGDAAATATAAAADRPTLCYLSDILFQNGMMAFQCARFDSYYLRMNRFARVGTAIATAAVATVASSLSSSSSSADASPYVAPLTVHANFCNQKAVAMSDRGLWLLAPATEGSPLVCARYNHTTTLYGGTSWLRDITKAEERFTTLVAQHASGSLVQFHRYKPLYVVENGTVRPFPNFQTFVAMGLDAAQVVLPSVRYSQMLHDFFPMGPPLPDAADAPPGASFKMPDAAAAAPASAAHRELLRVAKMIHGHASKKAAAPAQGR